MAKMMVNVAIIGLTRVTASLGLALREYSKQPQRNLQFTITGYDDSKEKGRTAQKIGAVDSIAGYSDQAVKEANIVIVALPPEHLETIYSEFAPALKPGAVVLDTFTDKTAVIDLAKRLFPANAYLVGMHLLVNSNYLYDASLKIEDAALDLLKTGELILAPAADCPAEAIKLASDIAEILAMQPRFMQPEEFDGLADFTEHIPVLLSMALFGMLQRSGGRQDLQKVINPNFALITHFLRDLTAADIGVLWGQHPQTTIAHIDELMRLLRDWRDVLTRNNPEELKKLSGDVITGYQKWFEQRALGKWDETQPVKMELRGSSFLGGLFGGKG